MVIENFNFNLLCSSYYILASGERCDNLPSISDGSKILYVPHYSILPDLSAGKHYVGTIATYSCSPGYQLVGGSVRTCVQGGMWNGTEPTCGMLN